MKNEPVLVYFKDDEEEGKVILWGDIKEGFRNFDLKNPKKKGFRISN